MLTNLQKEFCRELPTSPNATTALEKARHKLGKPATTRHSLEVGSSRMLRKDEVQSFLSRTAADYKITPQRFYRKLDQLLEHKKTLISPTGEVIGQEDDPGTQLKAAEMVFKTLPVFRVLDAKGDGQSGSKHLHLYNVNPDQIRWLADSGELPEDESNGDQ